MSLESPPSILIPKIEAALRTLDGIDQVRVQAENDEILEIHVASSSGRVPKHIVRDVHTLLQTKFNIVMDVYRGETVEVTVPIVNRSTGSMVSVFSVVMPDVPSAVEGVPGLTLDVKGSGRVNDVAKVTPSNWTYTALGGLAGTDNPGEPDGLTLVIKVAPTAMTGHFEITGNIRIVEM